MRTDLTVIDAAGAEHDLAIDAPPGTCWGEVRGVLRSDGLALDTELYSGSIPISPDTVIGDEALRAGGVVAGSPSRSGPPLGLTLDVIGGLSAGRSLRVTDAHVVGRDQTCDLVLDDPEVSRRHLAVTVRAGVVEVRELSSTHPTLVEGAPLAASHELVPGTVLQLGQSLLTLRGIGSPIEARSTSPPTMITLPSPPTSTKPRGGLGPLMVAAVVPIALAALSALLFQSPQLLLFALLTPASIGASSWANQITGRRERTRREREYNAARARAEADLADAVARETQARRAANHDPVTLRRAAARDSPALVPARLSLGFGSAPASVTVQGAAQPRLWAVPVVLGDDGPVAVQGPRELVEGLQRWLLCQIVATCDVDVYLIATQRPDDWHWARWLPRVTPVTSVAECAEVLRNLDLHRCFVVCVDDEPPPELVPASGVSYLYADLARRCARPGRTIMLGDRAVLNEPGRITPFIATSLAVDHATEIARGLASDRAALVRALPTSCRLIEVLDLNSSSLEKSITRRWTTAESATLRTAIGRNADGTHVVDLDQDGPHALIAGTTGSGKSGLLKALIMGLAVNYRPDQVTFVLVDYKGGAAFSDCAALPHAVGLVTDLDPGTTRRALRSLAAELRRREALLAAAGAADLTAYRATAAQPALPRLVIVVDEFAAMTTELPEFIAGLIDIAQRGRSLGLHLVLATQRPAGAVSPEIRANTQLRIALRTVTAADSIDILDSPAAADIPASLPGRAIAQGPQFQQFQTGQVIRSTGPIDGITVTRLGRWRRLPSPTTEAAGPTDAELLCRAIADAAADLRCSLPTSPWLPALPSVLAPTDPRLATTQPVLPIGLVDLPDTQTQAQLTLDLIGGGGVLLVGGPRSGGTAALVTVARTAARNKRPANLEIYGIDCAGRGLEPLSALAHTGTSLTLDNGFTSIARLVERLSEQVAQRRTLRARGERVPLMLVLLDGWGRFAAASEAHDLGRTSAALLALARDAAGIGVTVLLTGDRTALTSRLTSAVRTRLVLAFADPQDYVMAGVDGTQLPSPSIPGRGIRADDGAVFQLIAPVDHPDAAFAAARPSPTAIRIRPLPSTAEQTAVRPGYLCLGLGGDWAEPVWLNLTSGARLLVVGGPRSGRSTLLSALLRQGVEAKARVAVAAPEHSPLHSAAIRLGLQPISPAAECADLDVDVLLVDDSETFLDTRLEHALEARIRDDPNLLVAVVARSDDPTVNVRGLAHLVRRRRTGILLQPGPLDGELLGQRLRRDQLGGPPGRAIVIGEAAWGSGFTAPLAVQTFTG